MNILATKEKKFIAGEIPSYTKAKSRIDTKIERLDSSLIDIFNDLYLLATSEQVLEKDKKIVIESIDSLLKSESFAKTITLGHRPSKIKEEVIELIVDNVRKYHNNTLKFLKEETIGEKIYNKLPKKEKDDIIYSEIINLTNLILYENNSNIPYKLSKKYLLTKLKEVRLWEKTIKKDLDFIKTITRCEKIIREIKRGKKKADFWKNGRGHLSYYSRTCKKLEKRGVLIKINKDYQLTAYGYKIVEMLRDRRPKKKRS